MEKFFESPVFWITIWCIAGLIVGNWFGSMSRSGDFYEDVRLKTRMVEAWERIERTSRQELLRRLKTDEEFQKIIKQGLEFYRRIAESTEKDMDRRDQFAKQAAERFAAISAEYPPFPVTSASKVASPIEDMLCPQVDCGGLIEPDGKCERCGFNTGSPRVLGETR